MSKYTLYFKNEIHTDVHVLSNQELCEMEDRYGLLHYSTIARQNEKIGEIAKIMDQKDAWRYINRLAHDNVVRCTWANIYMKRRQWCNIMLKDTGMKSNTMIYKSTGEPDRFAPKSDRFTLKTPTEQMTLLQDYVTYRQWYNLTKRWRTFQVDMFAEEEEEDDVIVYTPPVVQSTPHNPEKDIVEKLCLARSLKLCSKKNCWRGTKCNYLHVGDTPEIVCAKKLRHSPLYKTIRCYYVHCQFSNNTPECWFAHRDEPLRKNPLKKN